MKGLYRGFCRNENGAETIVLNGEKIKGEWKYGYIVERAENDGEFIGDKIKWEMIIKSFIFPEFKEGCYEVIPKTVCEAVRGLTDRNGKQVFEGDIVATKPLNEISVGYENNYIGKVIWTNEDVASCGCCYPSFKGCGYVLEAKYERLQLDNDCEVIGTIFDEQFAEGEKNEI